MIRVFTSPELLPNFFVANLPVETFHSLINYVQKLPYKRISNSENSSLVIQEKRGTCSAKHAFLAATAHKYNYRNIQLEIGIFEVTTNGKCFPEAHCYLVYERQVFDFTHAEKTSIWSKQEPIDRFYFDPYQIGKKTDFHKNYMRGWSEKRDLEFEKIWQLRETFIAKLTADPHRL